MKSISKYIDLAFCFLVLPGMVILFPIERWYHHFQTYIIAVGVWLYLLYFLNRFLTVPLLFKGGKKQLIGYALIVLSLAVTYGFSSISLFSPGPHPFDEGIVPVLPLVKPYQQAVWTLFMIVETFSFAVGLLIQINIQRAHRREVEAERDRAEINLYKAQIKPHFMFNTLNSLYGLFLTGNDNALPSLEKFISMMRYIHTTARKEMVALKEEADYIRQLVDIQSLRLNEKTKVDLRIDLSGAPCMIPPMLLVTFVENCFKHGISPVEESEIEIRLIEREGELTFSTSNRIFPVKRIGEHSGIENCRRRLALCYPGRHSLDITDDDGRFNVELTIDLRK